MKKSTTYFVNSLDGSDENDGLSVGTAFKTLNKIQMNNKIMIQVYKIVKAKL